MRGIEDFFGKYNNLINEWNKGFSIKSELFVANIEKNNEFVANNVIEELLFSYTLPSYPIFNKFEIEKEPKVNNSKVYFANDIEINGIYIYDELTGETSLRDHNGNLEFYCGNDLFKFLHCICDAIDIEISYLNNGPGITDKEISKLIKHNTKELGPKCKKFVKYLIE